MKHCKSCNVDIATNRMTCPLCFDVLTDNEKTTQELEDYIEYKAPHKKFHIVKRIFLFLSIIVVTLSILINFITFNHTYWSLIVVGAVVYLWVLINFTILSRKNIALKMIIQALTISILLGFIQLETSTFWVIPYAIPSIMVITTFSISLLILIKTMRYKDYMLYLFSVVILGLIPLILMLTKSTSFLFKVNESIVSWPSIACALYSIFTFIGMFIFGDHATKDEFKKRFHI